VKRAWVSPPVAGFVALALLVEACSSDESGDGDSDTGGTGSGAAGSSGNGGAGGAGASSTGGAGGTGGQAPLVDCGAVCNRVRMICEGQSTIDDNWVDVCTRACEIRVEVAPETALMEKNCVDGATTCTTAVLCVASPSGTGGAGASGGASGGS